MVAECSATGAGDPAPQGCLLIVGGSERLDKGLRLLRTYAELCDRVPSRRDIVIVASATGHPDALGGEYYRTFGKMGWPWDGLHLPPLATRDDAANPQTAALIDGAAGIYMTGGDQVSLVETLKGTACGEAMRAAYMAGAVIGGTSAGATAIGDPMIARGGGSGEVKPGELVLHPGLGFAGANRVIDTHFGRRGRFPRLAAAVAEKPGTLGIGIDENTALLVRAGRHGLVLGTGSVYLITSPPAEEGKGGGAFGLHLLREGQEFDLAQEALV